MKMYTTGGVCENEFCEKCPYKAGAYCNQHQIGLVVSNIGVMTLNRHIIENCAEPWKNGLMEVLWLLRSYAQEPIEEEFSSDEPSDDPSYVSSKITVGMVDTIVSEVNLLGLFDDGELDKFMETER